MRHAALLAAPFAVLGMLAACATGPSLTAEERDARQAALVGRQLELLNMKPAELDAYLGPAAGGDAMRKRWETEGGCVLQIEFGGDGAPVMADFEYGEDDAALLSCERWL